MSGETVAIMDVKSFNVIFLSLQAISSIILNAVVFLVT